MLASKGFSEHALSSTDGISGVPWSKNRYARHDRDSMNGITGTSGCVTRNKRKPFKDVLITSVAGNECIDRTFLNIISRNFETRITPGNKLIWLACYTIGKLFPASSLSAAASWWHTPRSLYFAENREESCGRIQDPKKETFSVINSPSSGNTK